MSFGQDLIDILRGKDFSRKNLIKTYFSYINAMKHANEFTPYKIIFKFDDLKNCDDKVLKLDKFIKKQNLKVCWGIIGNSLENPTQDYIDFIKNNNNINYQFFNHGYNHLGGPEYEFQNKSAEEQESIIRKTQEIIQNKTGIILDSFGAPCNHIDDNTRIALENIQEIKYWFYGLEKFNRYNIIRLIDMENGVGKPDFRYFLESLKNYSSDNEIITLQGHPYMWHIEQEFNFYLIIRFLKQIGCEFIFPSEIGEKK